MGRKSNAQKLQEALENEELKNYKPNMEKQALYFGVFSGFVISTIGVYLAINKYYIIGIELAGRFSEGGNKILLFGPAVLILGLFIFIISVYYVKTYIWKKK